MRWLAMVAALGLVACPSDSDPPAEEEEEDEDTGDEGDDTTTTAADSTTGDAADGSTGSAPDGTTGSEEEQLLPARQIKVDFVEANQGVGVNIGLDGTGTGPEDRNSPLVRDRITLVRAFWRIPDDWVPREIEAHLILKHPDGTEEVKKDAKMVTEESFIGDLDRCFFWGVEAEKVVPGLEYRVEFYETDFSMEDVELEGRPPTLPEEEDEFTFVGVEDSYSVMKIVLVPFNYDADGCTATPDISEETMQLFQDYMFMQNPLDRLDFEIRDAIEWDTELTTLGQINAFMAELRFDDGALPETYYYGLIDNCMGNIGGTVGLANGIPSDPVNPDAAFQRVSSGFTRGPEVTAETFVHEVGHCQGRRHVTCNGEEGGANPSYPHEGGDVGEWGFGIVDFQLRHPTFFKDYMTYCTPTWVGSWGWNKVYNVIQGLSEWDDDFPGDRGGDAPTKAELADPYSGSLLVGIVSGEYTRFFTVPGGVPAAELSDEAPLEVQLADGTVVQHPTRVQVAQDDGMTRIITTPLPPSWGSVAAVAFGAGTERREVARADIGLHHHQRTPRRDR